MCIPPVPPVTWVAGIRTRAKTADTAAIAAAPMNPREKASAAPVALVREPAELAIADRTATPSAAPTSCPVMRNPDATPACDGGIPVIEVTETGTNTMPTPSPSATMPGSRSVAKSAWLVAADSSAPAAATSTRPAVATTRGDRWPSMWRATTVPTVMASAKGRKATPVCSAE